MVQWLRTLPALLEDIHLIPELMSSCSQLLVTPTPGNAMLSFGLCRYCTHKRHTLMDTLLSSDFL